MEDTQKVRVEGSDREPLPGARRTRDVEHDSPVSITVVVRRPEGVQPAPVAPVTDAADPAAARRARRQEFAARHAADPADLDQVSAFAAAHGLSVEAVAPAERTVRLSGPASAMQQAFGVELAHYAVNDRLTYRGRTGFVHVPPDLAGVVDAVLGLDDRPQARYDLRQVSELAEDAVPDPAAPPSAATSFWASQVAALYDFPTAGAGAGEAIALIELGGGYTQADLATYFGRLGIPVPSVVTVGVDGADNAPGDPADAEVELDIQVAGAVAPSAEVVVYFAPNTDAGFLDAVKAAVHDQQHAPSVISISWGSPESAWTGQAMQAMDAAFADAAAMGVTVLCAAGDHGAWDGAADAAVHADFPASSPHVVGCGGTHLSVAGTTIAQEVVWNSEDGWATGGGVSEVFDLPAWQQGAGVPASRNPGGRRGRGVPDVAGDADPSSGYVTVVGGRTAVTGGTSAVAPLYAGLVALLNNQLGAPVGALSPQLYAAASTPGVFRDITQGDNSVPATSGQPAVTGYTAGPGWDACTGLGSIDGSALLAALRAAGPPA